MTYEDEAEILCDVFNSRIIRAERRVAIWLPRKLTVIHWGEKLELYDLIADSDIRLIAPAYIFQNKATYFTWQQLMLREIVKKIEYGKILIKGSYGTVNMSRNLDDCIEYKPEYFI